MRVPPCLDPRIAFPDHVVHASDDRETPGRVDPWCLEIRGRHGCVYPHGHDRLQAYTPNRYVKARLLAVPYVVPGQIGDSEVTVLFRVDQAAEVFRVLGIRKKRGKNGGRPMTQEERERLIEASRRRKAARSQGGALPTHRPGGDRAFKGAQRATEDPCLS